MVKQIRVLHLLHSMNRGGAETMIMNYYREINRDKLQFDFLLTCPTKCDYEEEILALGGKIYRVTNLTLRNPFQYIFELNSFFRKNKDYYIIHSHTDSKSAIPLLIAKFNRIQYRIAHAHSAINNNVLKSITHNILRLPLNYLATDLFSCSSIAGRYLFGNKNIQCGKVKILKNAIKVNNYKFNNIVRVEYRKKYSLEDKIVLGHVGRFDKLKNHLFLLDIFSEVNKIIPNTVLILVGRDVENNEMLTKIENLNLKNKVYFLGVREDVPQLLNAMDLFIFPSINEGLGIAVIEAQTAGLPCVISDGIPSDVIFSNSVKPISLTKSPEEWAQEIINLINNEKDRSLDWKYTCSNGYDVNESSKWLEEYYLSLIDKNRIN